MSHLMVPSDVAALLRVRNLRAVSTVGDDGAGWLAVPSDTPSDVVPDAAAVEVLLLAAPPDEALVRRASAWAGIVDPHVQELLEVRPLDAARTAVLVRHVPGSSLKTVRGGRWPLSDAEAATAAIGAGRGLGALHAAGLAHGGITADRIVVRDDGLPVLVDPRRALTGEGSRSGDLAGTVAALVAVLPEPDADVPVTPESATLRQVLLGLARAGCQSADELEQACFAVTTPAPIGLPDAGSRAAASLLLADRAAPLPRRSRRRPRWPALAGAALTLAALLGTPLALRGAGVDPAVAAPPATSRPASVTTSVDLASQAALAAAREALTDHDDPAGAAAALTVLRGALLADPGTADLTRVEAADSPALAADGAVLTGLAGTVRTGLEVQVESSRLLSPAAADEARVDVVSRVGAHAVRDAEGDTTMRAPGPSQSVELTLRWTTAGWRVWAVSAPQGS